VRLNPLLAGHQLLQRIRAGGDVARTYDFNPLGFDPFRKLLEAHIDFALPRGTRGPELLIAATGCHHGSARALFRRRDYGRVCGCPSACLPTIHHAVTIDGQAYWDGGFSANPDLLTVARESPSPIR
jgi:NTE family protein